eukprot:scaffold309579_cov30-Prasinocladus_malaysianus.AAC.2
MTSHRADVYCAALLSSSQPSAQQHDQLLLASTTAGTSEWLEVLEGSWDDETAQPSADEGCVVGWKGRRLRLTTPSSAESNDGFVGVEQ